MSVSFCMAFVATSLVGTTSKFHIPPTYVWLVYSATATVSAILIGCSAPSSAEFHREASLVTGTESKPFAWNIFRAARRVLTAWSRHCGKNTLFNCFATLTYCWLGAWASSFVTLVDMTMDAANGQRMLQLFAIIGGVMAGVVQPVIGYIFDRIGLRLFFAIVNVALLVNILLMDTAIARFRPFHVQVIVLIISTFVQVQKNGTFCAVFILKMHHFPKADSGQTQGKHSKKEFACFLAVVVGGCRPTVEYLFRPTFSERDGDRRYFRASGCAAGE
jgi:hypothetical protein